MNERKKSKPNLPPPPQVDEQAREQIRREAKIWWDAVEKKTAGLERVRPSDLKIRVK